ncbi:MAG: hypothetical protein LBF55_00860 [Prevotellaceae bacterium]|nr:hypothetical protein [Prevotellaceae bacterium]
MNALKGNEQNLPACSIDGYYDGVLDARTISAGFDNAYATISKILPAKKL